ncbi:unnamed protein product [Trifolium pratense]|uniref:Uncharacterized protein n=1 Tax=Trifolium pratense TaxID=57577 RepID=A0ACB0KRG8_TRIPR|nr:unnamed protein product [Trifolium pratense]
MDLDTINFSDMMMVAVSDDTKLETHSNIHVCVREGKLPEKSKHDGNSEVKRKCSTMRMGCPASLVVSKEKNNDTWAIKSFDNKHNHVMASPKSVAYLKCHKKMNGAAKNLVEKFCEEGLPTGKVATMFNDSDLVFSNRDCWNHMRNVRMKILDVGDAQAVFNYCKHKQSQNSDFFYAIQCDDEARMRCIRESPTIKDFEDDWQRIMDMYNLKENEWLQRLFEIRESWIPVYNRSTFFAGMNTTQRSESINSFFDSFVNSTTTLEDFVVKFEKAVNNRYEAEKREDFESRHKLRILSIKSKIEVHAESIYTRNVFGKFQDELAQVSHFTKEKIERNGSQRKHILVIFQAKNILEIPSQYILHRWTKEANRYLEVSVNAQNYELDILRSMHVQQQFSKFANFAKQSEEAYKFIMAEFERICNTLATMGLGLSDLNEASVDLQQQNMGETLDDNVSYFNIKDPHVSLTKGRKKDSDKAPVAERFKSGMELSMEKTSGKSRKCGYCGEYGHYQSTCKSKTT